MGSVVRKLLKALIPLIVTGCFQHRDRTITFTEPPRPDTSRAGNYRSTYVMGGDSIITLDNKIQRTASTIDLEDNGPPKLADPSIAHLWKRDTTKVKASTAVPVDLEKTNRITIGGLVQSIALDKDTYRQGEIAILTVTAALPLPNAQIRFLGQKYKLYQAAASNDYTTVLAVPMDTKEGKYTMTLTYKENAENKAAKFPFKVVKGKFADEDTVKMDIGVLTEETLEMLQYEGNDFWKAYSVSSDSQYITSEFIWPCTGVIGELFGTARNYNKKLDEWSHKALDISAPERTKVFAANDGVVVMAMDLDAHGKSIVIDHGQGIHTVYLHLNDIKVKEKDRVAKGQLIGLVGSTGICTGPNLHWQIVVNGNSTDPRYWMKGGEKVKKGTYVKSEPKPDSLKK